MSIEGAVAAAVLQFDHIAVAARLADERDLAVAGGLDRRADGRGVILALVVADAVELRVEARGRDT